MVQPRLDSLNDFSWPGGWDAGTIGYGGVALPATGAAVPIITAAVYLLLVFVANSTVPSDAPKNDSALSAWRRSLALWTEQSSLFCALSVGHNITLICFSTVIFLCVTWDGAAYFRDHGLWNTMCPPVSAAGKLARGRIAFWCYAYYLSKYYELLDTLLIAARGKRIIPLHCYHHLVMLPTMWWCFEGDLLLSLFGVAWLNSFVHVIMYTYYLFCILKWPTKTWKKMVTRIQIIQFVCGAIGGGSFLPMYFSHPRIESLLPPRLSYTQGCAGDAAAILVTIAVNLSFLLLFSQFFHRTYHTKSD